VHPELTLGDLGYATTALQLANLRFESRALRLESQPPVGELGQRAFTFDARGSAPYDDDRHNQNG
jgi:hypothetical protein